MKNLNTYIPSIMMFVLILVVLGPSAKQELNACVPDIDVKGQLWTSVFKTRDGDHMMMLDTSNQVLSHYSLDLNGHIQFHGFRNIKYDYFVDEVMQIKLRAANGNVMPYLAPHQILALLKKRHKESFDVWFNQLGIGIREAKEARKNDKYIYVKKFFDEKFKECEKSKVRMFAVDSNANAQQRLFLMDRTNGKYFSYEIVNGIGIKLCSVRDNVDDEKLSDPKLSKILSWHYDKNITREKVREQNQKNNKN